MTLILDLPPDVETRLHEEATRNGVADEEFALELLDKSLPANLTGKQKAAIAMLQSWIDEDATDDPEEIRKAEEELEEFKRQMNANRYPEEPLYL